MGTLSWKVAAGGLVERKLTKGPLMESAGITTEVTETDRGRSLQSGMEPDGVTSRPLGDTNGLAGEIFEETMTLWRQERTVLPADQT